MTHKEEIPEDYYLKYPEQSKVTVAKQEKQRIEKEALEKYPGNDPYSKAGRLFYIAGATAERERKDVEQWNAAIDACCEKLKSIYGDYALRIQLETLKK